MGMTARVKRIGNLSALVVLLMAAAMAPVQGQQSVGQSQYPDSYWCNRVEMRLDSLLQQLQQILAARSTLTMDQWTSLVTEVAALRAENAEMKRVLAGQTQQLASLDEVAIPNVSPDRLSERIGSLAAAVENLLKNREEAGAMDLAIAGFVDASGYSDHNDRTSSFGLDQVEIDLNKGLFDQASVRADIECLNDGEGGFAVGLEQGYVVWSSGKAWKWHFTFGKFAAPVGYEGIDPTDMYQYSYGLVSTYCLPGTLTGAMMSIASPTWVELTFCVANGWDLNSDNNRDKTFGARLALSPNDNLSLGFSALSGPELENNNSSRRTIIDTDLSYGLTETWLIGAEVHFGTESKAVADTGTATWNGALLMTNVKLTSRVGLTLRGDYLNDKDGNRTGVAQEATAVCISPSLTIAEGFTALAEFRYDWSNRGAFADSDGSSVGHHAATALEFTYGF